MTEDLTPKRIVEELDRDIVGQADAKRAVALALRDRWRRRQLGDELRPHVTPKNILLIGPTGVGKTEIARRLARLVGAPFVKIEATKFTEVGYHGRDVESMVRDLVEAAILLVKDSERKRIEPEARKQAEERILDLLLPEPKRSSSPRWPFDDTQTQTQGSPASVESQPSEAERYHRSREKMKGMLERGEMEDVEVEVTLPGRSGAPISIMGASNMEQMEMDLQNMFERILPKPERSRRMNVRDARPILVEQEAEALLDQEEIQRSAVHLAEESGIIFLDELDKVAGDDGGRGPDVSRQGVQRDLLPIVEGTTVNTKHGPVRTDHVLFIAAGAFHRSKPSDLMPELQGRFPIRVELDDLTAEDFARILREPRASLIRQHEALLKVERIELAFTPEAIEALAEIAFSVNHSTQNIGARRLHTILERVLERTSFEAPEIAPKRVEIDEAYVREVLEPFQRDEDLSRYIL